MEKTLQTFLDELAKESGFSDWENLITTHKFKQFEESQLIGVAQQRYVAYLEGVVVKSKAFATEYIKYYKSVEPKGSWTEELYTMANEIAPYKAKEVSNDN